jgi:hypothetical protein
MSETTAFDFGAAANAMFGGSSVPVPEQPAQPAGQQPAASPAQPAQPGQKAAQQPAQPGQQQAQPAEGKPAEGQQKPADGQPSAADMDPNTYLDPNDPVNSVAVPVLKEMGLSRQQTEKLMGLRSAMEAHQSQVWNTETMAAAKADPFLIQDAKAAIARYASPQLLRMLNETGLGNHPAMVRFAAAAIRGRK